METRLRLIWVLDAGWDRPLCNRAVLDPGGRLIGHPDLMDPRQGVLGEYNGADHRGFERRRRDVDREDKFRRVGLECFTVEGRDIDDVALVLDRMAAARARAGVLPQLWTVAPTTHPPRDAARTMAASNRVSSSLLGSDPRLTGDSDIE